MTATLTCYDDDSTAHYLVLVPWLHVTTREEGADWTPLCQHCLPTGEDWKTVTIRNTPAKDIFRLLSSNSGN